MERITGPLPPGVCGVTIHCVVCGHTQVMRLPPNMAPQEFADQAGLSHSLCLMCGKSQAHRAVLLPPGAYICEAGCPHVSYEAALAYHQQQQQHQSTVS